MRLIDAEELLEHLEACSQNGRSLSNLYDLSEIVRYVKSMPAVAASPWRSVEEELPKSGEFGEIVLACNDVGTVNAAYLSGNGKWYAVNNTMYDAWTWMPNVTHWMPLPEPPQEVQDGTD